MWVVRRDLSSAVVSNSSSRPQLHGSARVGTMRTLTISTAGNHPADENANDGLLSAGSFTVYSHLHHSLLISQFVLKKTTSLHFHC